MRASLFGSSVLVLPDSGNPDLFSQAWVQAGQRGQQLAVQPRALGNQRLQPFGVADAFVELPALVCPHLLSEGSVDPRGVRQERQKQTFLPLIFLLLSVAAFACGGGDGGGEESLPFGLQTQTVTTADHVSTMAFAPDGRLFFAEKFTGDIRIVGADGKALPDPFAHLDVADWLHLDWGLTGLALDPN